MARENRIAKDDDAKLLSYEPYLLVMDTPLSAFDKRRIKDEMIRLECCAAN